MQNGSQSDNYIQTDFELSVSVGRKYIFFEYFFHGFGGFLLGDAAEFVPITICTDYRFKL